MNPKIDLLYGSDRRWYDERGQKFVRFTTLYLPYGDARGGCPDWRGKWKGGDITKMPCVFCALPNAVKAYQDTFYSGASVPHADMLTALDANIEKARRTGPLHTLAIFNGGSFLAMDGAFQQQVAAQAALSGARRLVIESRAELVTSEAIARLKSELALHDVKLTVRIGVETQDDKIRMQVLRKGHARKALREAVHILHSYGVTVGGYALVRPAPLAWIQRVHPHVQDYDTFSQEEAVATIDAILGEFGMDEVYFCSTCVAPDTLLEQLWLQGDYEPASLSLVASVLAEALTKHDKPIHLLPFRDEPAFVAVSSNHEKRGVHQDEAALHPHDVLFRNLLDGYREAMHRQMFLYGYATLQSQVNDCSFCRFPT
ncbi:hypothetical protein A3C89_02435 [Candidatus Kaiserbacteria bacterium RIFCSPHIGHO2_02_FULL_50_50]|uniref:Elp3/MiaA/NifB-like radical SAM core domain-containing protein n=1 Tax=Candidatus Kaiserbacteria bacterium RIFCSPHIGHO2_02_FULL_50_50 TaxID=1798492 RepID=A0A1F6DDE3_9BACT|nr:MAG: hypothetical protein A3C89_02435 [Candidatus Kaiserbacteria bacterium RIFCSPHIGHO2_02_FULL_50_50]OGG88197.1 MAG: hypothetical protein A3G62_00370 [Candidatus Kaiserbacteria bacterium RIFCSPLOWO2_12_FULL_50_10]